MKQLCWFFVLTGVAAFGQDPPSRVARLNFLQGPVSFQPGTVDEWAPATLNYPLTTGDHLYADRGARAELQAGGVSARLDSETDVTLLNLDDRTMQISLTAGALNLRIRRFYTGDVFEVDTPNGAVSLLRAGEYRIDCDPGRNATMVTVFDGDAEMFNANQSFPVHPRQTGLFSADGVAQVSTANSPDNFDRFSFARDRRDDVPPPPYVSPEMIGYQDLQEYGSWRDVAEYGPVWTPRVSAGWAPYRDGHWAWVSPWGWTWVDDSPWGFAPFHYGRWAYLGDNWGWIPGPVVARPVYAPALVAFLGGNNWDVSLSFGGRGGVGWFPLGPRDVYLPSYHVSRNYVNQVNITNVRNINVTNITNVRNVNYLNQNIPGAVTAISRQDFVSARNIRQSAIPVPVQLLVGTPVLGNAPIAPQRVSVLGSQLRAESGFRPPSGLNARPVFVRNAPPPAPISFAARQQAEAATPGRPIDPVTLQRLQQSAPVQRNLQFRPAVAQSSRLQPVAPSPQPAFTRPQPSSPATGNMPQPNTDRRVPFTRSPARPEPSAQPSSNGDRERHLQNDRQQPNGPAPFIRPPVPPAPIQQPQSSANFERERQIQLEQQRGQQLQRQQQLNSQPHPDFERQRQLQMEQQRQMQLERQRQSQPPNPNFTRQRQNEEQQRPQQAAPPVRAPQVERQAPAAPARPRQAEEKPRDERRPPANQGL